MLLNPPGLLPADSLPHWPYAQAVDQALAARGIPPGTVRVEHTGRQHGATVYLVLIWDVSRTAGPGSIQFSWKEETGWEHALLGLSRGYVIPRGPITELHRVFATPEALAEVADTRVRLGRPPTGEYYEEWDQAPAVRTAIEQFRHHVAGPRPL